jgi:hypothetical protein
MFPTLADDLFGQGAIDKGGGRFTTHSRLEPPAWTRICQQHGTRVASASSLPFNALAMKAAPASPTPCNATGDAESWELSRPRMLVKSHGRPNTGAFRRGERQWSPSEVG